MVLEDFRDLDEDGRRSVRSPSISSTAFLFDSPAGRLVAGMAIVGMVRPGCFGLCRKSSPIGVLDLEPRASLALVDACLGRRVG